MNYYKRNLGDFARDTAHLSQGQVGAYNLLLDWYYANERPLPSDMDDVYRIARASTKDEKKSADKVIASFFTESAEGWHQKRTDLELVKYQARGDKNRDNGAKGGRPIAITEAKPKQNPNGFDVLTQNKPSHILNTESSNTERARATSFAQQAARFDEFWAAYPIRKGKAKALARWKARGLDAIADRIIADVKARIAGDRQWLDGYAPHGSTYVNASGWEDAIEPPKLRAVGGSGYQPLPGEV